MIIVFVKLLLYQDIKQRVHSKIMKKILAIVFILLFPLSCFGLSVIPSEDEDKPGMDTEAGSGRHLGTPDSNICIVDTLADTGAGSYNAGRGAYEGDFRYCIITVESPKVVIFEVSGRISLLSTLYWSGNIGQTADTHGSYVTIAGQTAPSPGITISRNKIQIGRGSHDILIQHIKFRLGGDDLASHCTTAECSEEYDGMTISSTDHATENDLVREVIIDHCSFSYSIDEGVSAGADNMTIQNSIFSWPLYNSYHDKDQTHAKALYITTYADGFISGVPTAVGKGGNNQLIIDNIFAHFESRPRTSGAIMAYVNNLFYDYKWAIQTEADQGGKPDTWISIIGNYIYDGAQASSRIHFNEDDSDDNRYYVSDGDPDPANWMCSGLVTNPWSSGCINDDDILWPAHKLNAAPWLPSISIRDAVDVEAFVLTNAGARPADRDTIDDYIITEITGTSPSASVAFAPVDLVDETNSDCTSADTPYWCCSGNGTGTCDTSPVGWDDRTGERALTIPSNPHTVQASGYTALEEWLHGYSDAVEDLAGSPIDGVTIN
jgi:hypothetical protein